MRFLADENVSRLVIDGRRNDGFDVTSIGEMDSGAAAAAVLAAAANEDRVLVTEDRDFGEIVVRQQLRVRGVVLLELDRLSNAAEADRAAAAICADVDKLARNLIVIEASLGICRVERRPPGR